MNANVTFKVHGQDSADFGRKVEAIDAIARAPQEMPPGLPPTIPPVIPDLPDPVLPKPYVDIGDATGKAGDIVELEVEAGCRFRTNGFHIGGGCGKIDEPRSGYGLFEATGTTLGPYLTAYLKSHGLEDHWSIFQMVKAQPHRALPEEWWEYAVGFFSMGQERTVSPVQIPSGTKLFTLKIKILAGTPPGEYEVTCKDEWYYTNAHQRRRDFMFTADRDSPLASGGVTKLELTGGRITVTA